MTGPQLSTNIHKVESPSPLDKTQTGMCQAPRLPRAGPYTAEREKVMPVLSHEHVERGEGE